MEEPEGTRVHKIDGPPGKPRRTETKKRGGNPVKRPQARKNLKAENGKGPNMQTATTSNGYLGCLLPGESHRTAPNTFRKTNTDRRTERRTEGNWGQRKKRRGRKRESEPCEILREDLKAEARTLWGYAAGERLRIARAFPWCAGHKQEQPRWRGGGEEGRRRAELWDS